MKGTDKLTDKQKLFVFEYLIDQNATQAAIRAGYSKKTAGVIGNENLKKPYIQAFLEKYQNNRAEKSGVLFETVINELKKIGFVDINPDNIRPNDKIKALECISKLLGFFDTAADENIEDMSEAEQEIYG